MTDERRTLSRLGLSRPTVWPIVVALSAAVAVVGLFIHAAVVGLGIVLALLSLAGWAAEDYR
ncbi:MAG TPA: cytochrome c oxidase subunit 4, partial [Dehalococcoidia bacterium]|nr:cytochrome c oxidase subunit 4 [Dehalococcoidia bacterium]